MTAIVFWHQLFSASASKFAILWLAINGFNVKTKELENQKIQFHVNLVSFAFGCRLQLKPNRNFRLPHRPIVFSKISSITKHLHCLLWVKNNLFQFAALSFIAFKHSDYTKCYYFSVIINVYELIKLN